MLRILFAAVLSYLMGGFPTAIVVGKLFRGIDIRQYGSGNAGATNAFRVLGWKLALPVVLIDVFKGVAAVLFVAPLALPSAVLPAEAVRLICGVAAVAGHVWTPYAGFRGGKGVGTGFGAMIAIAPLPTAMASIVWIWVVLLTGYVSLASMLGAASVPLLIYLSRLWQESAPSPILLWTSVVLALGIVFTHRSNVRRLIAGKENRFSTPLVKSKRLLVK